MEISKDHRGIPEGIIFSSLEEIPSTEYSEEFRDIINSLKLYNRIGTLLIPTYPNNEKKSPYTGNLVIKWKAFEKDPDEKPYVEYHIKLNKREVAYKESLSEEKIMKIKNKYLEEGPVEEEITIYTPEEEIPWDPNGDNTIEDIRKLLESDSQNKEKKLS